MKIAAPVVRTLVEAVERAGIDREQLFRRARFEAARLSDVEARFEAVELERLWHAAFALTGDAALPLRTTEQASPGALDLVSHLLSHSQTLREAVACLTRFSDILVLGMRFTLTEEGRMASVTYEFSRSSPLLDRISAEAAMSGLARVLRHFGNGRAHLLAARFEHSAPAHRTEYTRIFDGKECFDQRSTAIEFERSLLDRTQLHVHPELTAVLAREAERALARLTDEPTQSDRLRRYLSGRSLANVPKMELAARDLGMSARSLRRKLQAEGVSYRRLVSSLLEELAVHMLKQPNLSVRDAAEAAGFSSVAAFHRAFKRWTGKTPGRLREGRDES